MSKLIVAAISARGYAQAAYESAYSIVTLDAFADADTRHIAEQCLRVNVSEDGVDENDFKQKFLQIDIDDHCCFIYGSLFDGKPALLGWVAERVKLIGNSAHTLQLSRSMDFFSLLEVLNIQHPEIRLNAPENPEDWLLKRLTGTGGTHVKRASWAEEGDYFQQEINGKPVSLLFAADGKVATVIGYNLQLIAPTVAMPYRYAGAVSHIELPLQAQEQFINAAQQLTKALGLLGINSLDAVLDRDTLWILELNPRLSASFHLYPNLLQVHIRASAGESVGLVKTSMSKAQLIIYADKKLNISADFVWPAWVADIPFTESKEIEIAENAPVCTVLAEAENAEAAHQLVLERVKILKGELFHD